MLHSQITLIINSFLGSVTAAAGAIILLIIAEWYKKRQEDKKADEKRHQDENDASQKALKFQSDLASDSLEFSTGKDEQVFQNAWQLVSALQEQTRELNKKVDILTMRLDKEEERRRLLEVYSDGQKLRAEEAESIAKSFRTENLGLKSRIEDLHRTIEIKETQTQQYQSLVASLQTQLGLAAIVTPVINPAVINPAAINPAAINPQAASSPAAATPGTNQPVAVLVPMSPAGAVTSVNVTQNTNTEPEPSHNTKPSPAGNLP